jgi:choline dehydrogenase
MADVTAALRAFTDSAVALGFMRIEDFNGPHQHGVGIDPFNVVRGIRQSTATAYLPTAVRDRPNLVIRGECMVDRIEFAGRSARGVRLTDGRVLEADEVILSAGAYASPAILMRSGIGPAEHLGELGIAVLADLPVGERLLDHPFYYNRYVLRPAAAAMHPVRGATLWTHSAESSEDELDLQITASNFDDDESPTGRLLVLAAAVMTPASVGCIRLQSRDPRMPPLIDYDLLADTRDQRRMLECVKLARRLAQTPPLADLIDRELAPGGEVASDDALLEVIRAELDTYHHGSGTVPMGGARDADAVVDPEGRLRNVEGARVIDASIFPDIPSTPTNLTTIMVAERIAANILRQRPALPA